MLLKRMSLIKRLFGEKFTFKSFLCLNGGIFMVAAAVAFFKNPNHFALGGVSGISLLVSNFFPNMKVGMMMTGLNVLILALGLAFLGTSVIVKSVYSSFALSGMVWLLETLFPMSGPLTNQKLLELLYAVFLPGFGAAIVFHFGATTGGTDIIAKILSKKLKLRVSVSLLISDFLIAASAGLVFGAESGLFSVLGVVLKVFALDTVMESFQVSKIMVVISKESEAVRNFIINDLHRDATINDAQGAYTGEQKRVITTILNRRQARLLQDFLVVADKDAFVSITNSSRIIGKGFERLE